MDTVANRRDRERLGCVEKEGKWQNIFIKTLILHEKPKSFEHDAENVLHLS